MAGVDEAGRGPLAGPVVAAAVILPRSFAHRDLKDSKLLSPRKRELLAPLIRESAVAWAVAAVGEREIERVNILQAALRAMALAVERLGRRPSHLLVDAATVPGWGIAQRAIIKGDRLSASIAAASIVAKVHRDEVMEGYHRRFPLYNFLRHKGYGTAEHRAAIAAHGPCAAHRRTFRGVREHLGE